MVNQKCSETRIKTVVYTPQNCSLEQL